MIRKGITGTIIAVGDFEERDGAPAIVIQQRNGDLLTIPATMDECREAGRYLLREVTIEVRLLTTAEEVSVAPVDTDSSLAAGVPGARRCPIDDYPCEGQGTIAQCDACAPSARDATQP